MRIVAARASFADGRMDGSSRKARAVMAPVAQAGLRCGKPFPDIVLFPVGDHLRIDRYVARGAAHVKSSMNAFPLRDLLMALQTVVFRGRGTSREEQGGENDDQEKYRAHGACLL
jgi:hypothetical protein